MPNIFGKALPLCATAKRNPSFQRSLWSEVRFCIARLLCDESLCRLFLRPSPFVIPTAGPRRLRAVVEGSWLDRSLARNTVPSSQQDRFGRACCLFNWL